MECPAYVSSILSAISSVGNYVDLFWHRPGRMVISLSSQTLKAILITWDCFYGRSTCWYSLHHLPSKYRELQCEKPWVK